MKNLKYFNKFYLDKEKDIVVELYKNKKQDEITYIIRTPNHKKGNLISNLAKICNLETIKDKNDLKIIKNTIPASLNGNNEEVYIFRLAGIKIANIYNDRIEEKAKIPAITKTLMSQTKNYKLGIGKTIVKTYIPKKLKFKTDLHTHMNANLTPDVLIALGIVHQIRYPLYYIKKINLKITENQEKELLEQRKKVEKEFENSELVGKYLTRRIDDNTFINFADLILNNLENAEENICKIRTSLAILKDGQAVFTNLEKVYLYRYVFCEGVKSKRKIRLSLGKIEKIPEKDIVSYVKQILNDKKPGSKYQNNTLRQDKYLWIAREYKKQGINYVEITDRNFVKPEKSIEVLEQIHEVMPYIEEETGVAMRFLVGIRRIPLTIIKDKVTSKNYLRENLDVLKAVAKSPYIVGSDFMGEEINDISELQPVIEELVQYTIKEDKGFTIRIHAGENDSLRSNIRKSIECIKKSLKPGQKMPRFRLGHGLYTEDLNSKDGENLMREMVETGAVLEFQLTSNVRLNNLTALDRHPLKKYLKNGVKCVQGTDGCGFYGTDTFDEQLALQNLIGLNEDDFQKMREVEEEILSFSKKYFKQKSKKFEKFLAGRTIREAMLSLQQENFEKSKKSNNIEMRISNKVSSEKELEGKIKKLPEDKIPIIIAGGSFNAKDRETILNNEGKQLIRDLIKNLNNEKVYFVVGHKVKGYEKDLLEAQSELNKKFEVSAIIPKEISEEEVENLLKDDISGIRISTEREEMGIYKSFNYEIFERRNSIVLAFDGNSPVSNLVQEAQNGKGKAKIYVNSDVEALKDKANSLVGYVKEFKIDQNIVDDILKDYPEIGIKKDKLS